MSKSIGNTSGILESPEAMWDKLRPAITDPARQKKTDACEPEKCPVIYQLHRSFSPASTVAEVEANCRGAKWGCIDCKKSLHGNLVAALAPIRDRAADLATHPGRVTELLTAGAEKARVVARATLSEVKERMGLPVAVA